MAHKARIVFAGSPEFAVPALRALQASPHDVVAVLTQPDRPAGRGRKLTPCPIKLAAADAPVLQPTTLRDADAQATLRALQPDLMVVVAYGLLLPPAVLTMPRLGCVNLHASLLPRWRGASPIQSSVLAGDTETGVCLMHMDEGLDTGPVYARVTVTIGAHESAGELHDRLAIAGGELLATHLDALLEGRLAAEPQPTEGVTYAGKIAKADGRIDWSQSAVSIDRQIRAYNPWPVAFTELDGQSLRCWRARVSDADLRGAPGEIVRAAGDQLLVATGEGVLQLLTVQPAGRTQMAAADFMHARELAGVMLGAP